MHLRIIISIGNVCSRGACVWLVVRDSADWLCVHYSYVAYSSSIISAAWRKWVRMRIILLDRDMFIHDHLSLFLGTVRGLERFSSHIVDLRGI